MAAPYQAMHPGISRYLEALLPDESLGNIALIRGYSLNAKRVCKITDLDKDLPLNIVLVSVVSRCEAIFIECVQDFRDSDSPSIDKNTLQQTLRLYFRALTQPESTESKLINIVATKFPKASEKTKEAFKDASKPRPQVNDERFLAYRNNLYMDIAEHVAEIIDQEIKTADEIQAKLYANISQPLGSERVKGHLGLDLESTTLRQSYDSTYQLRGVLQEHRIYSLAEQHTSKKQEVVNIEKNSHINTTVDLLNGFLNLLVKEVSQKTAVPKYVLRLINELAKEAIKAEEDECIAPEEPSAWKENLPISSYFDYIIFTFACYLATNARASEKSKIDKDGKISELLAEQLSVLAKLINSAQALGKEEIGADLREKLASEMSSGSACNLINSPMVQATYKYFGLDQGKNYKLSSLKKLVLIKQESAIQAAITANKELKEKYAIVIAQKQAKADQVHKEIMQELDRKQAKIQKDLRKEQQQLAEKRKLETLEEEREALEVSQKIIDKVSTPPEAAQEAYQATYDTAFSEYTNGDLKTAKNRYLQASKQARKGHNKFWEAASKLEFLICKRELLEASGKNERKFFIDYLKDLSTIGDLIDSVPSSHDKDEVRDLNESLVKEQKFIQKQLELEKKMTVQTKEPIKKALEKNTRALELLSLECRGQVPKEVKQTLDANKKELEQKSSANTKSYKELQKLNTLVDNSLKITEERRLALMAGESTSLVVSTPQSQQAAAAGASSASPSPKEHAAMKPPKTALSEDEQLEALARADLTESEFGNFLKQVQGCLERGASVGKAVQVLTQILEKNPTQGNWVTQLGSRRRTLLMLPFVLKHLPIAQLILAKLQVHQDKPALEVLTQSDDEESTTLMHALSSGQPEMLKLILEALRSFENGEILKQELNKLNGNGETILMLAVRSGQKEIVRQTIHELRQIDPEPNLSQAPQGRNILDYAGEYLGQSEENDRAILELLDLLEKSSPSQFSTRLKALLNPPDKAPLFNDDRFSERIKLFFTKLNMLCATPARLKQFLKLKAFQKSIAGPDSEERATFPQMPASAAASASASEGPIPNQKLTQRSLKGFAHKMKAAPPKKLSVASGSKLPIVLEEGAFRAQRRVRNKGLIRQLIEEGRFQRRETGESFGASPDKAAPGESCSASSLSVPSRETPNRPSNLKRETAELPIASPKKEASAEASSTAAPTYVSSGMPGSMPGFTGNYSEIRKQSDEPKITNEWKTNFLQIQQSLTRKIPEVPNSDEELESIQRNVDQAREDGLFDLSLDILYDESPRATPEIEASAAASSSIEALYRDRLGFVTDFPVDYFEITEQGSVFPWQALNINFPEAAKQADANTLHQVDLALKMNRPDDANMFLNTLFDQSSTGIVSGWRQLYFADVCYLRAQFEEARQILNSVIPLINDPSYPTEITNIWQTYFAQIQQRLQYAEQSMMIEPLEVSPSDEDVENILQDAYQAMKENLLDKAQGLLKEVSITSLNTIHCWKHQLLSSHILHLQSKNKDAMEILNRIAPLILSIGEHYIINPWNKQFKAISEALSIETPNEVAPLSQSQEETNQRIDEVLNTANTLIYNGSTQLASVLLNGIKGTIDEKYRIRKELNLAHIHHIRSESGEAMSRMANIFQSVIDLQDPRLIQAWFSFFKAIREARIAEHERNAIATRELESESYAESLEEERTLPHSKEF